MKKLYIPIISIIFCTQQTECMELIPLPSSNDNGYTIITKDLNDLPKPTPIWKQFDVLSEDLYKANITDTEIRELVKQGAKLNYQKVGWNGPLIFYYAKNNTPQGIKNMETIIELGAAFHNIEDEGHTPLTIALQHDQSFSINCTEMIQFLIPYENPVVTIYEHAYYDKDGKWYETNTHSQEHKIREYLISRSLCHPNITTIKLLLDLQLMTANRGLKEFTNCKNPNQEVLNLLLAYGANNDGDILPDVMECAFPSISYITLLKQMCISKAFNPKVLEEMRTIKNDIDVIVSHLENNEQK